MNYTEEFNDAYAYLEKAIKDRSHLTQKVITDKNGHTRKVWVNPLDKEQMKKRKADIADFRDFTGHEKEKADFETIFKDILGDNIIKMRSIPSIDKTGETNFYMIDVDYDKSKDKIDGAKEKIKAALKEKGYELDGDIGEKHFDAHWQYSTHYPAEHRFAFHVKNNDKGAKPEKKEEPSPELLAKDKQYKKDYLSNKKNSWTTDKTLKADYDKSGLKKVTDDAYKFYKDMITNIDDSKQKELQKRETKVFESDNWRAEVKFDGDSVRLDVYFMTKPDNAGPLYSYYQKINEKWNQDKRTYDWWASNQVHRENGLMYYNGFNKDADWLKPLNMVRDMF